MGIFKGMTRDDMIAQRDRLMTFLADMGDFGNPDEGFVEKEDLIERAMQHEKTAEQYRGHGDAQAILHYKAALYDLNVLIDEEGGDAVLAWYNNRDNWKDDLEYYNADD